MDDPVRDTIAVGDRLNHPRCLFLVLAPGLSHQFRQLLFGLVWFGFGLVLVLVYFRFQKEREIHPNNDKKPRIDQSHL